MASGQLQLNNGSLIDKDVSELLNRTDTESVPEPVPVDSSWLKQSFLVSTKDLDQIDKNNRKFSSASFKFTDSSLGGNTIINPPPQFTRYADVRDKGLRRNSVDTTILYSHGDIGMGRYYSEAIDDNNQVIHLRFGVPQYNSLIQFFTGFYNSSASSMARTGRMDDTFINKFLSGAGTLIGMTIFPLAIVPIGLMMMGSALRFFMKWPASKFYYLKPSMPLYWNAVTSMVNQIGVNKGIINYGSRNPENVVNASHDFTEKEISIFSKLLPEMSKNGLIDVYAIANKAKRMEITHRRLMQDKFENDKAANNDNDWYGKVKGFLDDHGDFEQVGFTLETYMERWFTSPWGKKKSEKEDSTELDARRRKTDDNSKLTPDELAKKNWETEEKDDNSLLNFWLAEEAEGSEWVSFRVDYTGQVSESFNSATGESSLAQKINGASSSARNIKVNYADGNIDSLGIVKGILDGVTTVVQKAADVLQVGGLAAFAGNSFVDIPKHWESSSAKMPQSTYTLTLISPYGNPVSQMFNIYIPLCMLLAGALPLSTGKQSYTAPFMCELYDRGRAITRLGIIDSLTIQRGTSNLGFSKEGQPMAIEVSFSVLDMSTIVAMPIYQGFSLFDGLFDTENTFSDYLSALSAMSLRDVTQRIPMLKYAGRKKIADIQTFLSASHFGQVAANLPGVNLIGAFMKGTTLK